ncbi:uncharacterized protein Tco025E_06911 [Trypanosoma conorhini]|uniref:Uncharacterized protein n=1 Tax=Trypanosoma conorhini TaxID=83891 RepID=A0A422NWL3_9TRYP|nr:uncharacterized protein Tco025E_06911 [Trypanosoma conorhini]RNF09837.1 hypothetical protein Tco025E_06911 [Trypanosoma conorhini]
MPERCGVRKPTGRRSGAGATFSLLSLLTALHSVAFLCLSLLGGVVVVGGDMLNRHGTRLDIGTPEDVAELEAAERALRQEYGRPHYGGGSFLERDLYEQHQRQQQQQHYYGRWTQQQQQQQPPPPPPPPPRAGGSASQLPPPH